MMVNQTKKSNHRLKVFQKITGDLEVENASRSLEIKGCSDLNFLLSKVCSYGDLQSTNFSSLQSGAITISFFDIRASKSVYYNLDPPFSIKYLNCSTEQDFVTLSNEEYNNFLQVLPSFGDIMNVEKFSNCYTVRFFDIRAARAAFCAILKNKEFGTEKTIEQDSSFCSDSTAPSPYLIPLSTSDSNENSFEERYKAKKSAPKDDKFFKIKLETVLNKEDSRTTLMIRNIPNKYTQTMLLECINKKFSNCFDFFYLPIDFKVKPT